MQEQGQSQLGIFVAGTQQVALGETGAQEQRQSCLGTFVNKRSNPAFDDASARERRRSQPLVLRHLERADGQVAHVCIERGAHGLHAIACRGEPHAGMVVRELIRQAAPM